MRSAALTSVFLLLLSAQAFPVDSEQQGDNVLEERFKFSLPKIKPPSAPAPKPPVVAPPIVAPPPKPVTPPPPPPVKPPTTPPKPSVEPVSVKPPVASASVANPVASVKPTASVNSIASGAATSVVATRSVASSVTASASASASACPIKPKGSTKPAAPPKRSLAESLALLFRRDGEEFVGFHGTNSDTAAFWESQEGKVTKPPAVSGLFDFINGFGKPAGVSGADADLGPGLYITDSQLIAQSFAETNKNVNKGTTAKICAMFTPSLDNWRLAANKVFLPDALIGDEHVTVQGKYFLQVGQKRSASSTVVFANLDPKRPSTARQMLVPSTLTSQFLIARCFTPGDALPEGVPGTFSYETQRADWRITPENNQLAQQLLNCD